MRLEVNGSVNISGDLFVRNQNMTVPDYVFEEDYELMPLGELKKFIKNNKYLPSKNYNYKDSSVTERDYFLLEKIEELVLYILNQEKRIKELENRLKVLEKRLKVLEEK